MSSKTALTWGWLSTFDGTGSVLIEIPLVKDALCGVP
jgi:hypothetical protein